jgi:hypothetical protein
MQAWDWVLWQTPWTGELYEIGADRVVQMAAEGRIAEMGQAFPILSNCVVPRAATHRIVERFGSICDSTGPDAAFTFRFCATAGSYLHLDRSLGVTYALDRSNGAGFLSGKATDFEDWKRRWGDDPWLEAAPLPGLNLGWNILFHEYELARREVGDERFPPLSWKGYLDGLAWGLGHIADPGRREQEEALLKSHGWVPPPEEPPPEEPPAPPPAPSARLPLPKRAWLRLAAGWDARKRELPVALLLARTLRIEPDHITGATFDDERRALWYALRLPRRRVGRHELLDWRHEGDACT